MASNAQEQNGWANEQQHSWKLVLVRYIYELSTWQFQRRKNKYITTKNTCTFSRKDIAKSRSLFGPFSFSPTFSQSNISCNYNWDVFTPFFGLLLCEKEGGQPLPYLIRIITPLFYKSKLQCLKSYPHFLLKEIADPTMKLWPCHS